MNKPDIASFFDEATNTVTYIVTDPASKKCAIIDSVLNYDASSGRTNTTSANALIEFINQKKLNVEWILETHAHADHFSAAPYLQKQLGGVIAIGEHIPDILLKARHSKLMVVNLDVYLLTMKLSKSVS